MKINKAKHILSLEEIQKYDGMEQMIESSIIVLHCKINRN